MDSFLSFLLAVLHRLSLRSLRGLRVRAGILGLESEGDHTAPGRQPLSSNPLSTVMTLSNLDHLLKHVPEQSAPHCVKNPTPLPNHRAAAGWLLAARRQGQGQSPAERERERGRDTHTNTHYEMEARKPPVIVT